MRRGRTTVLPHSGLAACVIAVMMLSYTGPCFSSSITPSMDTHKTSSGDGWATNVTYSCSAGTIHPPNDDNLSNSQCTVWTHSSDPANTWNGQSDWVSGNAGGAERCGQVYYGVDGTTVQASGCSGSSSATVSYGTQDPDWYAFTQVCVGYLPSSDGNHDFSHAEYKACSSIHPPADAVVCTASSFTIDHGQVSPSSFNGSEKSGTGSVKCTGGDASVRLYFSSSSINFSNGGKSSLTFSNGSTSEIVTAKENVTTSFTVRSKLSSSGAVKTGAFSGSTSIITDIQ